jgi:demethylmenaquinone methyltransferase / 2-methoxy-6-polyprenyl-1,4-benzoquinol methylase
MTQVKPTWLAEGGEKRERVRALFADLAPVYDRVNGIISFAADRRWRRFAVRELGLEPGDKAADICSGTGAFLFPLREAVGESGLVVGLDFCQPMLKVAQEKSTPGELVVSDACALPVASNSVDAVTIGWGLRNVSNLDGALKEACRILKPGGRLANLDMAQPQNRFLFAASQKLFRPFLKLATAGSGKPDAYAYLAESTKRFASRQELAAAMVAAGFTDVRYRDFALGHVALHLATKPS